MEEEQEVDVEDVSEEESESKEGQMKTLHRMLQDSSVGPSLATDKS